MTGLLLASILAQTPAVVTLDLSVPGKRVSPTLYGLMTEEINYSYDGGLYGELVRNRAFLDNPQQPSHWSAVGSESSIKLDSNGPSSARPVSLEVRGAVANEGYWGIPVVPTADYRLSVWIKGTASGSVDASIESSDGSTVYARGVLNGVTSSWQNITTQLKTGPHITTTKDAHLVLRTRANATVWLAQVSLFPQTYRSRANGNRKDLMRLLVDMNPKFLRFPGGNYLEGSTLADLYPWKKTLGPIEGRPGHRSPWGYRSTDGMGLLEFLEWCEDMKAKPVLAVYAGYALNGQVVKAGPELEPYVQDALDEIEYVTGGQDTQWGRRRALDGHPEPFPLECVEVGNEDGFDKSGSYPARLTQFYRAIKAKYPRLNVISTTGGQDWLGSKYSISEIKPDLVDEHYYSGTWEMMGMATKYDTYERDGSKVFVGEWASHDGPAPWESGPNSGPTPNLICAIADAAFMTGLERNSDVVAMACYAPLLVNVNPGGRQWSINMIGYDCLTSYGSPSYFAQKMFATKLGDRTVPLTLSNVPVQTQGNRTLPALFASATRNAKNRTLYIKIVNALPSAQDVTFETRGSEIAPDGTKTVLSGDPKAMNTLTEPKKVVPVTTAFHAGGGNIRETLAPYSVTVLTLHYSN